MWRESSPAEFADVPWLKGLLRPPADAVWPRFMSRPHPDAIGSYGAEFAEFARARTGRPLDWWQRLAAARILEHDANGELVWREWLLTVARQIGKSWLVRELILWRLTLERRIGEPQEILYVANKLRIADKIQRPARAWAASQDGWAARHSNGSQSVNRGDVGAYGLSTSLAVVDEGWDVSPEHIADGITPTLLERAWSQLALISTAHHRCTSLFVDRRLGALSGDGTLLLEWSARPWLALDDRAGWRQASPRWTAKREELIGRELARALAGRNPGEDPLSFFRSQYLNQWPSRATAGSVLPGLPFLPEGVWPSLAGDGELVGPIVFAVEDVAGRAAAVAAAGRTEAGKILVECYEVADRVSAFQWAGMHGSSHPGSRIVVGTALANDPTLAELGIPHAVMSYADTKAALSALRSIVSRRELLHAQSPTLADQLGSLRVVEGSAGLRVISSDPWDLVRPAAWAVAELDRHRGSGVWVA
jgi:hypothetical protein